MWDFFVTTTGFPFDAVLISHVLWIFPPAHTAEELAEPFSFSS